MTLTQSQTMTDAAAATPASPDSPLFTVPLCAVGAFNTNAFVCAETLPPASPTASPTATATAAATAAAPTAAAAPVDVRSLPLEDLITEIFRRMPWSHSNVAFAVAAIAAKDAAAFAKALTTSTVSGAAARSPPMPPPSPEPRVPRGKKRQRATAHSAQASAKRAAVEAGDATFVPLSSGMKKVLYGSTTGVSPGPPMEQTPTIAWFVQLATHSEFFDNKWHKCDASNAEVKFHTRNTHGYADVQVSGLVPCALSTLGVREKTNIRGYKQTLAAFSALDQLRDPHREEFAKPAGGGAAAGDESEEEDNELAELEREVGDVSELATEFALEQEALGPALAPAALAPVPKDVWSTGELSAWVEHDDETFPLTGDARFVGLTDRKIDEARRLARNILACEHVDVTLGIRSFAQLCTWCEDQGVACPAEAAKGTKGAARGGQATANRAALLKLFAGMPYWSPPLASKAQRTLDNHATTLVTIWRLGTAPVADAPAPAPAPAPALAPLNAPPELFLPVRPTSPVELSRFEEECVGAMWDSIVNS